MPETLFTKVDYDVDTLIKLMQMSVLWMQELASVSRSYREFRSWIPVLDGEDGGLIDGCE